MTHAQIHGYLCSAQFPNHNHYLAWGGLGEKGGFKGGPLLCGSVKYVGRDIYTRRTAPVAGWHGRRCSTGAPGTAPNCIEALPVLYRGEGGPGQCGVY